jgi:DNA-binding GntR family transcriptional regulator
MERCYGSARALAFKRHELSKSSQVYELVTKRLVSAEYAFGERIFVKELGAETGASRQPIMSALNRLGADGFVCIIPQVGCEVINPSRDEIADFFLMFQRMEGLLAELAAQRRSQEQVDKLMSIQTQLISIGTPEHGRDYGEANRVFHHHIHLMAASPLLAQRQRNNFNMSDFFINHTAGFPEFMSESIAEHEPIIHAISKQQPERARLFAEAHIEAVADTVLSHLKSAN